MFIPEQMKDVLAGMEDGSSALQRAIEARATEPSLVIDPAALRFSDVSPTALLDRLATKLETDVEESFKELSERAVKLFTLEGVDVSEPHRLTREQRAALRYQEVTSIISTHNAFAQYLNLTDYGQRQEQEVIARFADQSREENITIVSASVDGAAAPDIARVSIENITRAALENDTLGPISKEELTDLAHSSRRKSLALATSHFSEFISTQREADQQPDSDNPDKRMKIERDNTGKLKLMNDFPLPSKEGFDVYSSIILGCPALRLIHPNRSLMTVEEKAALGSSNYIDHVLAAIINAASFRGMFSVEWIRAQSASLEKAKQIALSTAQLTV